MADSRNGESGARRFGKKLWHLITDHFGYKLMALGISLLIWIAYGFVG